MRYLKCFEGCVISVTGIDFEKRETVQKIIEENGGVYEKNLVQGRTTHLIAASTEGRKYKHAVDWGLPVVTETWISDCVESGVCLSSRRYDLHVIEKEEEQKRKKKLLLEMDEEERERNIEQEEEEENDLEEEIELYEEIKDEDGEMFMDTCCVRLIGFEEKRRKRKTNEISREQRLKCLLYYGGTSVLDVSCHMITHLVLSATCNHAMMRQARERCKSSVRVVNVSWILNCIRRRKVVSDSNYKWKEPKSSSSSSSSSSTGVFEIGGKRRRSTLTKRDSTSSFHKRLNKRRVVASKQPLISVSSSETSSVSQQVSQTQQQKKKKIRKSPPRLSLHRRVSASSVRMISDSQSSNVSITTTNLTPRETSMTGVVTSDALRNVLRSGEENEDRIVELRRRRPTSATMEVIDEDDELLSSNNNLGINMSQDLNKVGVVVPKLSQEVTYLKELTQQKEGDSGVGSSSSGSSHVDLNQEMQVLVRSSRSSRHRDPLAALLK